MVLKNIMGDTVPFSQSQKWYSDYQFSKENALSGVDLPETYCTVIQDNDPVLDSNRVAVLAKIKQMVKKYPNTTFYFFYSPLSMATWYTYYAEGEFDKVASFMEISMRELLRYENVKLYFPITYDRITCLDSFKDLYHYGPDIQYQIFEDMHLGRNQITENNYRQVISDFRTMVHSCDFAKIFG